MSDSLKKHIREVPDYPKEGILFYDITTLLKNPAALRETVDRFVWLFSDQRVDKVIGIESRGFMFAPMGAYSLNAVEMHEDAIDAGERVLIVDDLLATGGTARATAELASSRGADLLGFGFIVELAFLNGREQLPEYPIHSLITY